MMLRGFLVGTAATLVVVASLVGGAIADRTVGISFLDALFGERVSTAEERAVRELVTEESAVVAVVDRVSVSVVTVSIETPQRRVLRFSPFEGFRSELEGGFDQDIGSGFIVDSEGLIVTNKHVVDTEGAKYKVITNDDEEHEVKEIIKDPSNDLAILRIDPPAGGLKAVELGDSSNLRVGQFVIAIGTALGEFRHTVTTGVVSGLGRGITAGSPAPFVGFVERLDDVIQTDAAINPGNSGGPLLDSSGRVIGVNTAVSAQGENIGFAIPVNLVVKGLEQFRANGQFASKPFLGVQYQMVSRESAILNEVPEGAFVVEVVDGSAADRAGIEPGDIIVKIDGIKADSENDLAEIIANYEPGDIAEITVWRDGETKTFTASLSKPSS